MSNVIISGIGVISALGCDVDSVWGNLNDNSNKRSKENIIEFEPVLKKNKLRRVNRYSHMGLYAAIKAKDDAKINLDNIDEYRVGTIFTTGYGPLVSNLEFSKSVIGGDPDLCSPTLFANTVSNSCIGHICMNLGCKGVSTIVMGSNNIGYSKSLINSGKADYIITGSVEEHCEELYTALEKSYTSKNVDVREGTIGFILQKEELMQEDSTKYCSIKSYTECDLGGYPLTMSVNEIESKRLIMKCINECIDRDRVKIDAIITSNNNTYFDEVEDEVVDFVLKGIPNIKSVKKYFGETLGSAFNMNIMTAALCLKNNCIPKGLMDNNEELRDIENILVTGYDVSGNYICMNLSK
ncbi:beta-ketoacyl synthase N-terminal-like domain-containing protein [Clostridium paraputrificum]|uniref:beta-ketoacyl synthase N-terminal-like domain-containing protein n=1 Tax=Clostridium TaxID=1485 RepID=UPI003D33BAA5